MRSIVLALFLAVTASAFAPQPRFLKASTSALFARQPFIAGNWKMNPETIQEAEELGKAVAEATKKPTFDTTHEVAVCVPYPFLETVKRALEGSPAKIAAQSIFFEDKGAFTGSVSSHMIRSMGCEYVLAGHSERRTIFKDDDGSINRKVRKILDDGMRVILCIGESFDEYQGGLADVVCRIELSKDLNGVEEHELENVVIAYEPCWAIGTGLTCDPNTAQKVHEGIRDWFRTKYSPAAADAMRIQYGGSVTPETVSALMRQPDIDGALVGGASLDAEKFAAICNYKQ